MMDDYNNNESGAYVTRFARNQYIKMLELKKCDGDYILKYAYIDENDIVIAESTSSTECSFR